MPEFTLKTIFFIYVFVVGTVVGSFLNVVIYRVPRGLSVASGRSMCPSCGHVLGAIDLIPILGWIFLKGRCRYCKSGISPRYPLVELLGGIAALACFAKHGFSCRSLFSFLFLSVIIAITFIDIDTLEIPNGLILSLGVFAVALSFCGGVSLLSRVVGFLAVSVPMFVLALVIPDSFGGGDIKLVAVCGFALGWRFQLLAAFLAIVLGGAYGVYLLKSRKKGRKEHFAFGPFLSLGAAISMLAGDVIVPWYLGFFK
ncbi:MAG: prepilin peptidase [Oscillospiraceae bacterium]